jgi:hypothetical protein
MCIVEDVLVCFRKGLLGVLKTKGVSEPVLDEILAVRGVRRMTVLDELVQRDLLQWLDRNTTMVLKSGQGQNTVLEWIACLFIGEMELTRNMYFCYVYEDRVVVLSPFPVVEQTILSKIQELERDCALAPASTFSPR